MKNRRKYYTTHNLNEAAFFVLSGLQPKIIALGPVNSEIKFRHTLEMERCRLDFWSNSSVRVNLSKWIMIREQMKDELAGQIRTNASLRSVSNSKLPLPSQTYWYMENGIPKSSVYGHRSPHIERYQAKNMFPTWEEAKNSVKVPTA